MQTLIQTQKTLFAALEPAAASKLFVCGCGRCYKYKNNLAQHQRLECGKPPQFPCKLCPYKAKQKSSLKSHFVNKHSSHPFPQW